MVRHRQRRGTVYDGTGRLALSKRRRTGSRIRSWWKIQTAGDGQLYSVRIDQPYSRLEVTVPDAVGQLELNLYRACDAIGKARLIGKARFIGGDQEVKLVFDVGTETGVYYLELLPTPEAQGFPISYRLRVQD